MDMRARICTTVMVFSYDAQCRRALYAADALTFQRHIGILSAVSNPTCRFPAMGWMLLHPTFLLPRIR